MTYLNIFEKMLPKFDPNEKILVDDHFESFYLEIEGLRVGEHEDVVCRLFLHTLKGAAAPSYFFCLQTLSQTGIPLKGFSEVNMQPKRHMQH